MHFRPGEAIEVIENHRRERRAKIHEFLRRFIKFSALVIRADDEDAHVALAGRLNGGPVQVIDEIPMDVDVIELIAVDGIQDDVGGGVSGETEETNAAFLL